MKFIYIFLLHLSHFNCIKIIKKLQGVKFNIHKSTVLNQNKKVNMVLHNSVMSVSSANLLARLNQKCTPSSHRKWDTQHLGVNKRPCITFNEMYTTYSQSYCVWTSKLTRSLFHSPEVQRRVLSGGKLSYTLHSGWDKTRGRRQPHSPQLEWWEMLFDVKPFCGEMIKPVIYDLWKQKSAQIWAAKTSINTI